MSEFAAVEVGYMTDGSFYKCFAQYIQRTPLLKIIWPDIGLIIVIIPTLLGLTISASLLTTVLICWLLLSSG